MQIAFEPIAFLGHDRIRGGITTLHSQKHSDQQVSYNHRSSPGPQLVGSLSCCQLRLFLSAACTGETRLEKLRCGWKSSASARQFGFSGTPPLDTLQEGIYDNADIGMSIKS